MSNKNIVLFFLMFAFIGGIEAQADSLKEQCSPTPSNLETSPYPAVKQAFLQYQHGIEPFSHVLKTENHCLINELETNLSNLTPTQRARMLQRIERNFDELIKLAISIDDSTEAINLKEQKYETLAKLTKEQCSPRSDSTPSNFETSPYPTVKQAFLQYQHGIEPFSHVLKTENHCLINELEINWSNLAPAQRACLLQRIERNFDELIKLAISIDDSTEAINLKEQKYETLAKLRTL